MKFLSVALVALTATAWPTLLQAADAAHDLDLLIADHDRAVAAALDPVNRRYVTQLESLQRRATQANDLETALKIKKMIDEIGDTLSGGSARADVVGTWNFEFKATGAKVVMKFLIDGSWLETPGADKGTWEIKGKNLIVNYSTRPGVFDKYELPIRAGRLSGSNSSNEPVSMMKRAGQ